jgi:hypothetical protein
LVTIDVLTCNFSAISLLDRPSAQANTTRDRRANACPDLARRDQRSNCSRSASLNSTTAAGRPVRATPTA